MINIRNITKTFDGYTALENITSEIPQGSVYGMVGSNGAGKSTFLRILAGIYKADKGEIYIDDSPVYENPDIKKRIVFVPDDLFFLSGASLKRMKRLYQNAYPSFDEQRYNTLLDYFKLPETKSINTFSKGMKRQAAIILSLSARPDFIFFDETFDGLDPVMRSFVKSLIYDDVAERGMTCVLASHSLRELEDVCDALMLLHKGQILLENNVNNLKSSIYKVQVGFGFDYDKSLFDGLNVTQFSKQGSVSSLVVKGELEETKAFLQEKNPVLLDILPLTLEEVFVEKMQESGYDFSEILQDYFAEQQTNTSFINAMN